jgi:aspartate aminotransferase
LSPPLIEQIIAEASIDGTEEYSREVYEEYTERRKTLIDGVNKIPGCYTPIPMGAFYSVAKLPVDDSEMFCAWCLKEFVYHDENTPTETPTGLGPKKVCADETIMMAPAARFYTDPSLSKNQVRLAYVLNKHDLKRALFILEKTIEAYNKK